MTGCGCSTARRRRLNLLLDTNALIWLLSQDSRLHASALAAIPDPNNQVFASAINGWEIAIKVASGKLRARRNVGTWLPEELSYHRLGVLPVEMRHAMAVEHLPDHHRDPFDRLLIAQANADNMTIVTSDPKFNDYQVRVLPS